MTEHTCISTQATSDGSVPPPCEACQAQPTRRAWSGGVISHDEANNIAMGYIDHCFGNPEKIERRVAHSIPANERRDSDLRLTEYIRQQREKSDKLDRAMAVVKAAEAVVDAADPWFPAGHGMRELVDAVHAHRGTRPKRKP